MADSRLRLTHGSHSSPGRRRWARALGTGRSSGTCHARGTCRSSGTCRSRRTCRSTCTRRSRGTRSGGGTCAPGSPQTACSHHGNATATTRACADMRPSSRDSAAASPFRSRPPETGSCSFAVVSPGLGARVLVCALRAATPNQQRHGQGRDALTPLPRACPHPPMGARQPWHPQCPTGWATTQRWRSSGLPYKRGSRRTARRRSATRRAARLASTRAGLGPCDACCCPGQRWRLNTTSSGSHCARNVTWASVCRRPTAKGCRCWQWSRASSVAQPWRALDRATAPARHP